LRASALENRMATAPGRFALERHGHTNERRFIASGKL
jgi:hypothetical protein